MQQVQVANLDTSFDIYFYCAHRSRVWCPFLGHPLELRAELCVLHARAWNSHGSAVVVYNHFNVS